MSCFSPLVRLRDRTSGRDHHEEDGWDNGSGCSRHSYARERRARYRRIRRFPEWVAQRDRGRNCGRRDGSGLLTDPQRNGLARARRGSVTSATPRDLARRCGGAAGATRTSEWTRRSCSNGPRVAGLPEALVLVPAHRYSVVALHDAECWRLPRSPNNSDSRLSRRSNDSTRTHDAGARLRERRGETDG